MFKDHVVIITGASSGIGRACAVKFGSGGGKVVVNYRADEKGATETVKLIEEVGGEAIAVQGDVSERNDCEQLVEKTLACFGRIDILVNNAGILQDQSLDEVDEVDWHRTMDVNAKSVYMLSVLAGKVMKSQGHGVIVNVSSIAAEFPRSGNVAYVASKGAVSALTHAFAVSLAPEVRVNAVAPGRISTEMSPFKDEGHLERIKQSNLRFRDGQPEDVANLVAFLASDEADWISGEIIVVDGGCSLKMASLRGRVEVSHKL